MSKLPRRVYLTIDEGDQDPYIAPVLSAVPDDLRADLERAKCQLMPRGNNEFAVYTPQYSSEASYTLRSFFEAFPSLLALLEQDSVQQYASLLDDPETVALLRKGGQDACISRSSQDGDADVLGWSLEEMKRNLSQPLAHAERCIDQQQAEYERERLKVAEDKVNLAKERENVDIYRKQLAEKEALLSSELEQVDRIRAAIEMASVKKKGLSCC